MVPCFPLLGLTPSELFMSLSSTIIYTSELILCSTICVPSATLHNIHMYPFSRTPLKPSGNSKKGLIIQFLKFFCSYRLSHQQEIPNPSVEGMEDMSILISGTAQFIIWPWYHENFKSLNPQMFETNPKLLQFGHLKWKLSEVVKKMYNLTNRKFT